MPFAFELRIPSSLLKKVLICLFQVSQGLLQRDAVSFFQPWCLLFQVMGQISAFFCVFQRVMTLLPKRFLLFKIVVIYKTTGPKGPCEERLLFPVWICAIPLSSDTLHDTPPNVCSHCITCHPFMQYRNKKFLAFYSEMALLQSDTRGYSRIAFFGPYRTIHPSTCRSGGFLVKLLDKTSSH